MKQPATCQLFAYWNALRGERTAPERCDIDPARIRAILADTFMLDVSDGFPVRVAGTRVAALLDKGDQTRDFLDLWRAEERHNLAAMVMSVADTGSPIVIGAAGAPAGRAECAFELLLLPLRHFGKTHSRILGIITAATGDSGAPSWLGLMPVQPLVIRSLRIIDAAEAARRRDAGEAGSVGMRTAPLHCARDVAEAKVVPLRAPLKSRPALRLIEGGRPA